MSIKVAAWNVAKGLGNDQEAHIYEGIKQLDAEVVVLGEAYATDSSNPNEDVIGKVSDFAMDNGYDFVIETGYHDEGSDNEALHREQYLVVLGRQALKGAGLIRLDNRSAIGLTLLDNQTDVEIQAVAAHFRDENEQLRQDMAQALTALVDTTKPTLLIGDLNAMHRNSNHARLVRSHIIRGLSKLTNMHPRAKSLSARLIEMADGGTMEYLKSAGFKDADRFYDSTFKFAGVPFGQLDHIMFAGSGIVTTNAELKNLKGSDHKAISTIVHTNYPKVAE